ncbi:hypothetical protein [Limnohabitans sp.]|uniref:hypothetical protein n=1 Tax=Limnohabitans sp. TaxID=1907725 RepID=UPI00333FC4E7
MIKQTHPQSRALTHKPFSGSDVRAGLRVLPTVLLGFFSLLSLPVWAQNLSPTELASRAMSAPAVRAAITAQASASTANAAKPVNEHEAHLTAIRQAILNATIERPTRVISTAWVDEKGALHESAHFHSEAKVSGVRVLSYLPQDESPAQITADVLPWGYRSNKADKTCSPAPRTWRLPLMARTHMAEGFSGPQLFASQMLLNMANQAWHQSMQQSQRWRVQSASVPVSNSYFRALSASEEARSAWAADLSLKPHGSTIPSTWAQRISQPDKLAPWRWTLTLSLGQSTVPGGQTQALWQAEHTFTIDPSLMANRPSLWQQQLQTEIKAQVHQWVTQLEKRTECEPVQFQVVREGTESFQLQAGAGSGLRPGDRVLLIDPVHIPSRMLEAGVAQHLALAQVVKVGNHRSELLQLAGPRLPQQGAWLALPL